MGWTERDLAALYRRRGEEFLIQSDQQAKKSRGGPGKRADLGGLYLRSKWEANIARYLNWLKAMGAVLDWKYESREWEFAAIRRGTRFYKSDFEIWFARDPQNPVYWEVKGYLDRVSKTKLKRMALYYPEVRIVLIDGPAYRSIASQARQTVPGWE